MGKTRGDGGCTVREAVMRFTKAEEYGLFGVYCLAQKNRSVVTPLSEISEEEGIPETFLSKIFQSLSKAGLVRSHRGVRGGFSLARDPSEITVIEVLEIIQGPYHLLKCTKDNEACQKYKGDFCALRELVRMAEQKLVSVFNDHTIADLVHWQEANTATR